MEVIEVNIGPGNGFPEVRVCDGCGVSEDEALGGVGFWIYEGGASCGPCLKAEAADEGGSK